MSPACVCVLVSVQSLAGASQHALASETTDLVVEQLLDINTLAPIRLTQAVLPYMLKRCVWWQEPAAAFIEMQACSRLNHAVAAVTCNSMLLLALHARRW